MNQPNPYIVSICNQLENQLGFKIKNIADAQKCTDELSKRKLYISPHTIARLYGVVKPIRTPYNDTLNILSRFLQYSDWDDFCASHVNIPFDANLFLTEASDRFSLTVLQLALVNEDFDSVELLFSKAQVIKSESILFTASELIGTYVRKSQKQKELLEILAKNNIGRIFFYECYVDEDNEGNYFSDALLNYYLQNVTNDYRKLFAFCFVISQTAHKNQKLSPYYKEFQKLTLQLDIEKCHFQELSRWIECLILIDGYNDVLQNTWKHHLVELLILSVDYNAKEKAWLISRSLKALLLFGFKEELFKFNELNEVIDTLIKNQNKELHSIALYVLQLYWISKSMYFENKNIYNPFRIHSLHSQNESNERKVIEFAIASIFASGQNKNIIAKNLNAFCYNKGFNWVVKLIDNYTINIE